ncbi:MAG TPA: phosphoadenylyl-sulfate reductase [Bryobacteraceae bacterium]|nr:phosphoadenylyl-sulfate reductase [Bryobacteraceae bacterium]
MGTLLQLETLPAAELLSWAISTYAGEFAIATSFQKEGMVILDLAARSNAGLFRVFTLDTGRLPEETYQMMEEVRRRYGIHVETVAPSAEDLDALLTAHGPNLFYERPELRALCCEIRKVRPLKRKLREFKAWASGLRREQSETRADVRTVEEIDGRMRLCPLADWSSLDVERYIREHDVPVHPLYELGYASIGCAPCTRAVLPGEDQRSGRWWWELDSRKECGIHFAANGKLERIA